MNNILESDKDIINQLLNNIIDKICGKICEKKNVYFSETNNIYLIDNNKFIENENLKSVLWWSSDEQQLFRLNGIKEIKKLIKKYGIMSYKQLLIKKHNIDIVTEEIEQTGEIEQIKLSEQTVKTEQTVQS